MVLAYHVSGENKSWSTLIPKIGKERFLNSYIVFSKAMRHTPQNLAWLAGLTVPFSRWLQRTMQELKNCPFPSFSLKKNGFFLFCLNHFQARIYRILHQNTHNSEIVNTKNRVYSNMKYRKTLFETFCKILFLKVKFRHIVSTISIPVSKPVTLALMANLQTTQWDIVSIFLCLIQS